MDTVNTINVISEIFAMSMKKTSACPTSIYIVFHAHIPVCILKCFTYFEWVIINHYWEATMWVFLQDF